MISWALSVAALFLLRMKSGPGLFSWLLAESLAAGLIWYWTGGKGLGYWIVLCLLSSFVVVLMVIDQVSRPLSREFVFGVLFACMLVSLLVFARHWDWWSIRLMTIQQGFALWGVAMLGTEVLSKVFNPLFVVSSNHVVVEALHELKEGRPVCWGRDVAPSSVEKIGYGRWGVLEACLIWCLMTAFYPVVGVQAPGINTVDALWYRSWGVAVLWWWLYWRVRREE